MYLTDNKDKRNAILVELCWDSSLKKQALDTYSNDESLEELTGLAKTAGYDVVEKISIKSNKINPRSFLGKGKIDEFKGLVEQCQADWVVLNEDLTPSQNRNIENSLKCNVIDRCALILEIFAKHARTSEAKTQVELARLNYMLPRLTGQWSHLSRQRGGIGLREVGEKQLEIDRRLIQKRIFKLKKELERIDKERKTQRKNRSNLFKAALVGYTNAGKSTLMNSLTGSSLLVENKLFATLDSTVRTLKTAGRPKILITDTVGLIDKLPHSLVASFKSTLDEIRYANLIIKVVDITHQCFDKHISTTQNVLQELGVSDVPSFWVFNKIDLIQEEGILDNLKSRHPDSIFVSGKNSSGINLFKEKIKSSIVPISHYHPA